jgi:hypothetical protein
LLLILMIVAEETDHVLDERLQLFLLLFHDDLIRPGKHPQENEAYKQEKENHKKADNLAADTKVEKLHGWFPLGSPLRLTTRGPMVCE